MLQTLNRLRGQILSILTSHQKLTMSGLYMLIAVTVVSISECTAVLKHQGVFHIYIYINLTANCISIKP